VKSDAMPTKLLRATITIDVEALDYLEAADHQKRIEVHLAQVKEAYPDAWMVLSERRRPAASGPASPRKLYMRSGRLNAYE
jgi:hypothetical protein